MSSFDISKEETIDILFNNCSGEYFPSKKAVEMYNERKKQLNPDFIPIISELSFIIERHDPILVQIFRELGKKFNGKNCSIQIESIPKKYENFYHIIDYDGEENVCIDYDIYKLETIYSIITNKDKNMKDGDKIREVTNIFLNL